MARPLGQLILIFAVMVTVLGSIHYYLWARLVRDTALPPPYRLVGTVALVVLAISLPLSFFLSRMGTPSSRPLLFVIFGWMGLLLLLFLTVAATDLVRLVLALLTSLGGGAPPDPSRRLALQRTLGAGAASLSGVLGIIGVQRATRSVQVERITVPLSRLPGPLDGTTIVQLTDLHIGPTLDRAWLEDVVKTVNQLRPDIVAITGDLVDGRVSAIGDMIAPLGRIMARRGVYFVTGNHEYYSGADEWIAELGKLGVRVLRNERVLIGDEQSSFDLVGIDDYHSAGLAPGHGPDLLKALLGRDVRRESVLLAHQPKAIHEAAEHNVGLQLSGHTHGGQIWPWRYLVYLQQPYVSGLVKEGNTWLYVSRGTGYWGPPMRLGSDAEITHITLRARG